VSVENEMQASIRIGDQGFISLSQFCVQECSIINIWALEILTVLVSMHSAFTEDCSSIYVIL
jgi:hypothetical protein